MRKFIKDLWLVLVERNKIHKALRTLNKQEWSIEFLVSLMRRAAKDDTLELIVTNQHGQSITLRSSMNVGNKYNDIWDNLNDDVMIKHFMEQINGK